MTPFDATTLLTTLGRTTLALGAAAIVVQLLLWLARPQSPRVHRAAWLCVLLVGWLWLRVPVAIPYDVPASRAVDAPAPFAEPKTERGDAAPPSSRVEENKSFAPQVILGDRTPALQEPVVRQAGEAVTLPVAAWSWPSILLGLWLVGLIAMAITWLAGYAWFVWRLPAALDGPEEWHEQWRCLQAEQGLRRPIPLHLTTKIGPMLCRLPGGYRLVVPLELWQRLSPAGRLSVLRHELAHLRRGDVWKSLLMRLAALPHWFNPAAWWALGHLDEAAEWACDAAARGDSPMAAAEYARSLLALDELAGRHALYRPAAWGRGLSQRIRRLVAGQPVEDTVMKRLVVIGVASGLVAAFAVRFDPVANVRAEGEKTGSSVAVSEMAEPAPEAKTPPIAREALRYDGKSFDQWYTELKTELKTERRTEAIRAFTEFGRRGYGKEATQAILEVMRDYSVRITGGSSPKDLLKDAALAAFVGQNDATGETEPIAPEQSVPILINELKEGNENSRYFALYALASIGSGAKAAIPALMALSNSKPVDETTGLAIQGIVGADETGEHIVSLLRAYLANGDARPFGFVANELNWTPSSPETKGRLVTLIESTHQRMRGAADSSMFGAANSSMLVPVPTKYELTDKGRAVLAVLVEAVHDKEAAIRQAAIAAISQIQSAPKIALPILINAFSKGNAEDRKAVVLALTHWQAEFVVEDALWIPLLKRTQDFREQAASTIFALRIKPSIVRVIPKEALANAEFRRAYEEFRKEEPQWRSENGPVGVIPLPPVDKIQAGAEAAHEGAWMPGMMPGMGMGAPGMPGMGMTPGMEPTPRAATPANTKETPKSKSPKSR
jgi:beta-lactamase regulating signal transducer with metallopeptidase domain